VTDNISPPKGGPFKGLTGGPDTGAASKAVSGRPARLIANRETLADMGRVLDFVGECNCEVPEEN
jgi:hypothetical protein